MDECFREDIFRVNTNPLSEIQIELIKNIKLKALELYDLVNNCNYSSDQRMI